MSYIYINKPDIVNLTASSTSIVELVFLVIVSFRVYVCVLHMYSLLDGFYYYYYYFGSSSYSWRVYEKKNEKKSFWIMICPFIFIFSPSLLFLNICLIFTDQIAHIIILNNYRILETTWIPGILTRRQWAILTLYERFSFFWTGCRRMTYLSWRAIFFLVYIEGIHSSSFWIPWEDHVSLRVYLPWYIYIYIYIHKTRRLYDTKWTFHCCFFKLWLADIDQSMNDGRACICTHEEDGGP